MSKQQELRAILHNHYGNKLETPNKKQLANYAAHVATQDGEYSDFVELLGMYAGYYVIRIHSKHNYMGEITFEDGICATRLRLRFYTFDQWQPVEGKYGEYEKTGETYKRGSHTRFLFAKTVEGIINEIVAQIAYNAGSRSAGKGIWQRQLPRHLQVFPHGQGS